MTIQGVATDRPFFGVHVVRATFVMAMFGWGIGGVQLLAIASLLAGRTRVGSINRC